MISEAIVEGGERGGSEVEETYEDWLIREFGVELSKYKREGGEMVATK
jgi:hypothetical protein